MLLIGVLVALLGAVLLVVVLTAQQSRVATALLWVDAGPRLGIADTADLELAAASYAVQVTSEPVVVAVIEELDLGETPERLVGRISASAEGRMLTIEVRHEDPARAHLLALALGDEMVERSGVRFEDRMRGLADRLTRELQLRIDERFRDVMPRVVTTEPARLVWFARPRWPDADEPDG